MLLRPVLDFASITYHPMLSNEQCVRLELLQKRAVRIACGPEKDYDVLLQENNIPRLTDRREKMFERFAIKNGNHPTLAELWFKKRQLTPYDTRLRQEFEEKTASTTRLKNSPLFQLRKRLNNVSKDS